MEAFFAALEGAAFAQTLRISRWGYAAVNTAHVLGIALLLGAIVPLNLRLLGLWPSVALPVLARVLVPVAATGLAIAVTAGLVLFSVRAREYSGIGFLQAKIALIALGILLAVALHARYGVLLNHTSRNRFTAHASVSMICWLGAVICGRFIAFAGD